MAHGLDGVTFSMHADEIQDDADLLEVPRMILIQIGPWSRTRTQGSARNCTGPGQIAEAATKACEQLAQEHQRVRIPPITIGSVSLRACVRRSTRPDVAAVGKPPAPRRHDAYSLFQTLVGES